MKNSKKLFIFSGIRPGNNGGVGRLVFSLLNESASIKDPVISFIYGKGGGPPFKSALFKFKIKSFLPELKYRFISFIQFRNALRDNSILTAHHVVLIHPQTLGFKWCMNFISKRDKPTWVYIVDASFFCIRSANSILGENKPCMRCIGGNWENIDKYNCISWPVPQKNNRAFLEFLKKSVNEKKIKFLVQSKNHKELIKRHFGAHVIVKIIGLWADFNLLENITYQEQDQGAKYDIVFHGSCGSAKGFPWAIQLANKCPEHSFFFPCSKESIEAMKVIPGDNSFFGDITWENSLKNLVSTSKVVLCPTMWSAPIEGALIKSISVAQKTAVVDESTTYSNEISDEIVLKLPYNLDDAAIIIKDYIKNGDPLNKNLQESWIENYISKNRFGLQKILTTIE